MNPEQLSSRSGSAVFTDATTEQKAAMFEWLRQVSLAGKPPEWFHAGLAMHELNRLGGAVSERPALLPPTDVEVAAYRDLYRYELDKRMDVRHPSWSPSTESHKIALSAFVKARNAASNERPDSMKEKK